jgi:N-acetylneuraminate synthase/N,N'-diacetyllegionaminate synthase
MAPAIEFLGRHVGDGYPCYVIAEIGLNHNGSMSIAKRLISTAKVAGCNAVKFQKRDVANLAVSKTLDTKDERFPAFGQTYREIREHLEFDASQFAELMAETSRHDLSFLCTPFDIASVRFLESLNLNAYKVASHGLTNLPMLDCIASLHKPVILSTGMASIEEIDRAVALFRSHDCPLALVHCVSAYPTPIEQINLKAMDTLRERYRLPVGYSGHEIGILPTLAAVARGACIVERHITLDRAMIGFDHKLSLDPAQLRDLVSQIRQEELALGDGRKTILPSEQVTRDKYHVSLVSARAIELGETLNEDALVLKNPGTGIPAWRRPEMLGRKAKANIPADVLIEEWMLEPQSRPALPLAPRTLAIILARGGSQGVPMKNIRPLGGLPLIAWSIREGLKSRHITRLIVSTDSEDIAEIAKQHGAEVPFLRPAELATAGASSNDCLQHAVRMLEEDEEQHYDYVVELMCTNPLKTVEDIDAVMEKLISTGADSVIGLVRVWDHHPARIKRIEDDRIVDFCVPEVLDSRRQDLAPPAYVRNGSIYAMRRDVLMIQQRRYGTFNSRPYIFPDERNINIDSELDWLVAEQIVTRASHKTEKKAATQDSSYGTPRAFGTNA